MKNKQIYRSLLLLLTAFVWGTTFSAQDIAMEFVGPFTFNGTRFLLGGIILLPLILVFDLIEKNKIKTGKMTAPTPEEKKKARKMLLIGGLCCGLILFAASTLQQVGMVDGESSGKAGFITAFYIVLVPIFGLFLKKKCSPSIILAVALALIGVYLLCVKDGFTIALSDLLVLGCAIVFAGHILIVDHISPFVSGVKLASFQFLVCGVASSICMFIFETPTVGAIWQAMPQIYYAGVLSCAVGYTLQIIGQKNNNPAVASLIMSLESCFAVLAEWVIVGFEFDIRKIIGCVIMFVAIILAQFPIEKMFKKKAKDV